MKTLNAVFSPQSGTLSCGDKETRLTDQSRLCLIYFVEHEGELVTREALTEACWRARGVIVTDGTVRQTIFRLRRSLSDVGLDDGTLETVGKAGYLFAAGAVLLHTDDASRSADAAPDEPVSDIPVVQKTLAGTIKTLLKRAALSRRRLLAYALIIVIAGSAGYLARLSMMVKQVNYSAAQHDADRQYYFNERFAGMPRDTAMTRVSFWLNRERVPLQQSRYVYINGVLNAFTVAFTCDRPVEDAAATCRTFTLLGDNHS